MSTRAMCIATVLLAFALPFAAAQTHPSREWKPLFNGKDLEGWTPQGSAIWRVERGVLVGTQAGDPKRSGMLVTKDAFGDFELELEFMLDEHGKYNSGVYLRCQPDEKNRLRTGYQVNLGRGAAGEYCGGVFLKDWLAKGDEKDAVRKPHEWNRLRIVARGAHLVVDLNGVNVVDFKHADPEPRLLAPGPLALQTYGAEGHAGWVTFRNVRVRPL